MPPFASAPAILDALDRQAALFLALLLCVSALHKILWRARAQRATADLTGLAWRGAGIALIVAASAEVGAAGSMLLRATPAFGALLAAAIWSGYCAVIARAIGAGRREIDCGCSFGAEQRPLGRFQLLRAAGLAAIALLVAALGASIAGGDHAAAGLMTDGIGAASRLSQALGALALLALYAALDRVMALGPLRAGALR